MSTILLRAAYVVFVLSCTGCIAAVRVEYSEHTQIVPASPSTSSIGVATTGFATGCSYDTSLGSVMSEAHSLGESYEYFVVRTEQVKKRDRSGRILDSWSCWRVTALALPTRPDGESSSSDGDEEPASSPE